MTRLLLLAFLCLQAMLMSADTLKGRVVDAETGDHLPNVELQYFIIPINDYYAFSYKTQTDSLGVFHITVKSMSKVQYELQYFGYEPFKQTLNVAGGKDTIDLGDIKLKMVPELLKEVVVKGKAKRFVMKGDTVVFNPEAFNLDDGDRIATLLKQLPGVSIKEGKIYFNEKEVHLKINGRNVADDELTALLPAEAVDKIKAYEKKSELAEVTGMNDGQEQQVLDITIKPGFMDKWYGRTRLSAYASDNYLASANMHYLSDTDPIGVYARASDCGSKTQGVWGEYESSWENAVPQRQQYGKLSYKHGWKPDSVASSYDQDSWSVNTSPNHLDTHQNFWQNSETYIDGQPSSFKSGHLYQYAHSLIVPLEFETELHFSPKTWIYASVDGGCSRVEDRSTADNVTYQAYQYEENPQNLVNRSRSENLSKKEGVYADANMRLTHVFKNGDLSIGWMPRWNRYKGRADSHTDYEYHDLGTQETLVQTSNNSSHHFQSLIDAKGSYQVVKEKLKIGFGYWMDYWRTHDTDAIIRNGDYDIANSFGRMKSYFVNEPRIEVEADLGKVWMHTVVKFHNTDERFDYQRGNLDTLVQRYSFFLRPFYELTWRTSKASEMKASVNWDRRVADLLDGTNYVDDTDPLNIRKGNPGLKPSSTLSTNMSYTMMFTKGQQMLSLKARYARTSDPATTVMAYNSATGGYISMATNADYSESMEAGLNYDRALGKYFRLTTAMGVNSSTSFGAQTLSSLDEPWQFVKQTNTGFHDYLCVQFQDAGWESRAYADVTYSEVKREQNTVPNQYLWDYRIGLHGQYKLTHWTFSLDPRLVGNTGYLSDIMNRNRFVLDAEVTWKTLAGKAQFTLSARDILNQMDQVYSYVTAAKRSETRNETFHRYLCLTFTYQIDAKAKKDKH